MWTLAALVYFLAPTRGSGSGWGVIGIAHSLGQLAVFRSVAGKSDIPDVTLAGVFRHRDLEPWRCSRIIMPDETGSGPSPFGMLLDEVRVWMVGSDSAVSETIH